MRLIDTIANWVRKDQSEAAPIEPVMDSVDGLLDLRGEQRYDLRSELGRFSVELDGVHYQMWNVSVAGFAAAGDLTSAPERARARIFKDGVCTRQGVAILAWNDGQVAGYSFLPEQDDEAT